MQLRSDGARWCAASNDVRRDLGALERAATLHSISQRLRRRPLFVRPHLSRYAALSSLLPRSHALTHRQGRSAGLRPSLRLPLTASLDGHAPRRQSAGMACRSPTGELVGSSSWVKWNPARTFCVWGCARFRSDGRMRADAGGSGCADCAPHAPAPHAPPAARSERTSYVRISGLVISDILQGLPHNSAGRRLGHRVLATVPNSLSLYVNHHAKTARECQGDTLRSRLPPHQPLRAETR